MSDHSVHKAADLAGDERMIVERWPGRSLANDETISVNAYRPHAAPDVNARDFLRREIAAQAHEIGCRAEGITEPELDSILNEAFAKIRGKHE